MGGKIHYAATIWLDPRGERTKYVTFCGRDPRNLRIDGEGVMYDKDYFGSATCKICLRIEREGS